LVCIVVLESSDSVEFARLDLPTRTTPYCRVDGGFAPEDEGQRR
jgi:hypothetical protein